MIRKQPSRVRGELGGNGWGMEVGGGAVDASFGC